MEFNAKSIVLTFAVIEELGLANAEEIQNYLKKELDQDLDLNDIKLILERLRAKDILTLNTDMRYKIAKIPAPFMSVKMSLIKKWKSKDFQKAVDDVEKAFPQGPTLIQKKGYIKDYGKILTITFEAVDPILGGVPDGDEKLHVHRNNEGVPVISAGQMYGWFRSNDRTVGLDANAHSHIGFSEAVPTETPELIERSAPVIIKGRGGVGIAKYEAFPSGTKFVTHMILPEEGVGFTPNNYVDKLTELFRICSIVPVRGLGANPRYNGGRVRLIGIE